MYYNSTSLSRALVMYQGISQFLTGEDKSLLINYGLCILARGRCILLSNLYLMLLMFVCSCYHF